MTSRRPRRGPFLRGIVTLCLSAALALSAGATDFSRLYDQGVEAQRAGDLDAAAIKFEQASRIAPDNPNVWLRLALVRGYLEDYDAAFAATSKGLRADPGNTDLRLARARILGWAGRYDEGLRVADAVIAQYPYNAEAHAVRGRIAYYQGRLATADASFVAALRLDPDNAEAAAGRSDVARARHAPDGERPAATGDRGPRWRIDAGYLHSRFSRLNLEDWREGFVRVEHRWPGGTALSFRVDTSNRFGSTETSGGAGIARQFTPHLRGYLEGAVAPGADFLPRWTVAAGGAGRVAGAHGAFGPLLLTADLRHKSYVTGEIQNADPGFEAYGFDGRVWLTARWINAFDRTAGEHLSGWFARADWQAVSRFRLYAGLSDAPETEAGITVDTQSVFGGAAVDLTSNVRINADFAHEDRENSYIRNVFGVSLTLSY